MTLHRDLLNQANLFRLQGLQQKAAELLRSHMQTIVFDGEAAVLLYLCLVEMDQVDEASALLESWLAASPGNDVASYLQSALVAPVGTTFPERAPSSFIRTSYDTFAATFNQAVEIFQYRGAELFQRLLSDNLGPSDGLQTPLNHVLDAGCGTGTLGEALRNYATRLEGVDLSPQMLVAAQATAAYDHLECDDLLSYLNRSIARFDLVVAADSFQFFGNLKQLIAACFQALTPDGWLVFSLQEGPLDKDHYFLHYDGSYVHSPQYIIEQLGEAGVLGGSIRRAAIRKQFGQNIWALLIAVQRPNEA